MKGWTFVVFQQWVDWYDTTTFNSTQICGNLVWDVAGGSVANFQKNGTTMRCQLCTYDYISTEIEELVQASYAQKQEESSKQVRGNQVEAKSKLDQVWIPTYVEITAGNKNNN